MSQGIDVSEWQGDIDWPTIAADGIDFAIIRAGYGLEHPDPYFAANWANAASARIDRGAYLWFRSSQNPIDQAAYLAAATGPLGPEDLAPWVDFERQPGEGDTTIDGRNPREALGRLGVCLDELEHRTGRVPTIYTGPYFWRSIPGSNDPHWARYPLAIAHYGVATPDIPRPWAEAAYWQHSSAGQLPGIGGLVDLDLSLTPLITSPPGDPKEHPYMALNAPIVATITNPAGPGYWQIGADGGVFNYGGAPFIDPSIIGKPSAPITSAAVTPTGLGFYMSAADGGLYALGDAVFAGHAG